MSKSNVLENQQELGSHSQTFIYRIPKKNHDAIVLLNKQIKDTFPKYGPLHSEFFYLSSTETVMDFVNIIETISANQDEGDLGKYKSYRNRKHLDEMMITRKKIRTVNHFTNNI